MLRPPGHGSSCSAEYGAGSAASRGPAGSGDEARAAVGVLHRIDQHERVAQDRVDAGVALRGEQVIRLDQRGVGGRDLVAVNAVNQPHDDGQLARKAIAVAAGVLRGSAKRWMSAFT